MSAPDPRAMAKFQTSVEIIMTDVTEHLLEQANRTVPIEEGTLTRSGTATSTASGTTVTGVVAYDTPYAARQHEDTRLHHDSGRRAKWLESTMAEETAAIGRFIAAELAGAVS